MAKKREALGHGLDALFMSNSIEESSASGAVKLSINEIEPNKSQPRKSFDEKALSELADSIAEHGIIQPLLVRPMAEGGYQIVAGERRWRASRLVGLTEVPVVIKDLTDRETMEIALIENLQREDLNPIEEAEGIELLIKEYGLTQEIAAERVGKSRSAVTNSLRLLNLPPSVRELARDNKISAGHARALLAFSDEEKIIETAKLIMEKGISVRETERLAKEASKDTEGKVRQPKRRDVFYDEVEIALSQNLGRKVKINSGRKGGTIVLEYFDKDDLTKIAKMLEE